MENFKILKSKNGYFYIEEKVRPLYFTLTYFEFVLECVFGIIKYVWERDYRNQFKTYEDAVEFIKKEKL